MVLVCLAVGRFITRLLRSSLAITSLEISDYNTKYGLTISDTGYITYDAETDYYISVKYFVGEQVQTQHHGGGQFSGNGSIH